MSWIIWCSLQWVHCGKPFIGGIVHPRLGVELVQHIVILMGSIGQFREQDTEPLVYGDVCISAHLTPVGVVRLGRDTAILVGEIHHAAQPVGVNIDHVHAFLNVLPPPIAALASDLYLNLIQAVDIAEVIAIFLGFHQNPLIDIQPGVVDHIVCLHDLGAMGASHRGLDAGTLAVEVCVAVGVVLQDQLRPDAHTQAIESVETCLTSLVSALDHTVGLIILVGSDGDGLWPGGSGGADFLFLHQITALVVGIAVIMDTGDRLLIAAYSLGRHLIQVVILVGVQILCCWTGLLQ